jgi:predicted small secreted protein
MKKIVLLIWVMYLTACNTNTQNTKEGKDVASYQAPSHHTESVTKIFEAHGSFEKWSSMKSLSYTKGEESNVTNLIDRKIRLESPTQTIGFDGENVWISPDSLDASRARFYHNLYFYFYAMPFVVGDPGVFYEDVEAKEIKGKMYNGVKVSYDNGVGDSPKDNYILWVDPETNLMEWLMYTVTFRSGEASENYSLIRYSDWGVFNGLTLPTKLEWYAYEDGAVGESRNEAVFENIELSTQAMADTLFSAPENSILAPAPPAN